MYSVWLVQRARSKVEDKKSFNSSSTKKKKHNTILTSKALRQGFNFSHCKFRITKFFENDKLKALYKTCAIM